jgi:uncharacterized protein YjhX (UPF0386 family)
MLADAQAAQRALHAIQQGWRQSFWRLVRKPIQPLACFSQRAAGQKAFQPTTFCEKVSIVQLIFP